MTERSAVQNPMLYYADEIGWSYVNRDEALALRGGERGMFFTDVLTEQLVRLNPGIVDVARAADIVRQLGLLKPSIDGNKEALSWLRGEKSIFVPSEKRERNVKLIDFDTPENNVFQVTDEWRHKSVVYANRADVVFLINGIPVAIAETKRAGLSDAMAKGVEQVRRYHEETPEMLISPQIFEVTQLYDFYYGITWNTSRKNVFNWKEEDSGNFEQKVKHFFDRHRFLQVLEDYIVFLTKDDELTKVILRQHQTGAVEKVLERVADPTKRRGLVWHTQGSGKTLTMITIASKLLREARSGQKPTVLMLVDRNELETQLFRNITGYGISTVEVAQNKRELQRLLASDYRGLIVSMIHKFDDIPANLNTRDSIVVLVDEAHRTTGGDLGNYLMAAIPNATYIGFTGTPIDNLSKGKGTFKVFGVDDERGYLDKYSVGASIEDGTTLKLNYALAPSDLQVDRETLEKQFLAMAESEGVADVDELNAILNKAVELKELMKAPDRVAKIAAYVAEHFKAYIEPMGFKAFLVGVDREACALYKKELDKYLPAEYSKVVYTAAHNDRGIVTEFHQTEDAEKEIRKAFAQKDTVPKILIVTEKLLTGYDAPILYCMYLDKPMRDHVLLQAIARVNRPYEDATGLTKPYGFVLDFVGIFERLEKALAFDSDVVASAIQNIDVLKQLFATLMREQAPTYVPLTKGWDDKAKERAIGYFEEKETRDTFFKLYKQLQNLYDILSPDAFLRPYIYDYLALSELYTLIRDAYSPRIYVDRELTAKTRQLLRSHTESSELGIPGAIHQLGAQELEALRESDSSDTTKVLNLRKVLAATVADESQSKPFLLSIGERAEAAAQAYENRQLSTQEALEEFERLAQSVVDAERERETLGVDENTFAIFTALQPVVENLTTAQAKNLNALFVQYPDYQWAVGQQNALRTALYKALRPLVGAENMIAVTKTLMRLQRV